MKFIKKHKLAAFIVVLLVAAVVAVLIFSRTIMFDESKAIYGNRLDGRDKVELTSNQKKEVEEKVAESADKVNVRMSGKVIYVTIKTKEGVDQATAKSLGDKALEVFTADQKSYFDIQFLIENDTNKDQYPILGYKHRAKDAISWTKDR